MMKSVLRAVTCLLAVLMLACPLAACSSVTPSPKANKVVATAGNVEILYDELYFLAMNRIAEMKEVHGEDIFDDAAERAALESFVWENLLTRETALISIGYDYELNVLEGEIGTEVDEYIADVTETNFEGKTGKYVASLNAMYMTDRYARVSLGAQNFLPTAIVKEMMKRGELDTSDETATARIYGEEFIRTVHVFISKDNALYDDQQNRAHANEIYEKLVAIADDSKRYKAMREAIGGAYNNDFADTTGNGYYFAKGEMDAAYEEAAFALAEYAVSEVVETEEGFYIIMRMPKEEAYIEENFEVLKQKTYFIALNVKVEERLASMTLEKTKFGAKLDLFSLSPIDANGGTAFYIATAVIVVLILVGTVYVIVMKIRKKKAA